AGGERERRPLHHLVVEREVEHHGEEQVGAGRLEVEEEGHRRFQDRRRHADEEHQAVARRHWGAPMVEALTTLDGGGRLQRNNITSSRREKLTAGTTSAAVNIPVGRLATFTTRPIGSPLGKNPGPPAVSRRSPSCRSSVRSAYSSLQRVKSPTPLTVLRPRVRCETAGTEEVGLRM